MPSFSILAGSRLHVAWAINSAFSALISSDDLVCAVQDAAVRTARVNLPLIENKNGWYGIIEAPKPGNHGLCMLARSAGVQRTVLQWRISR